jgi:hypothetical protein
MVRVECIPFKICLLFQNKKFSLSSLARVNQVVDNVLDITMASAQFHTLERERDAKQPSDKASSKPSLHRLVQPHLDSFNAIRGGLLELSLANLETQHIKDSHGNKLSCKCIK